MIRALLVLALLTCAGCATTSGGGAEGERAVHRAMERLDFVAVDVGALADADTPEDLPGHR